MEASVQGRLHVHDEAVTVIPALCGRPSDLWNSNGRHTGRLRQFLQVGKACMYVVGAQSAVPEPWSTSRRDSTGSDFLRSTEGGKRGTVPCSVLREWARGGLAGMLFVPALVFLPLFRFLAELCSRGKTGWLSRRI